MPQLRSTAEKWAGSLAVLLTGAGLTALVAGPKTFDALQALPRDIGKVIFFAGAVAGVSAALLAALAAQATGKEIWLAGTVYRDVTRARARSAAGQLACSRKLALVALALLLVSTAFIWFGPKNAKAVLVVETVSGREYCGTPQVTRKALMVRRGSAKSPPLDALAAVRISNRCPKK